MKLFKKRNRLFWSLLLSAFVMVCLNVRAADDDDDEEEEGETDWHVERAKLEAEIERSVQKRLEREVTEEKVINGLSRTIPQLAPWTSPVRPPELTKDEVEEELMKEIMKEVKVKFPDDAAPEAIKGKNPYAHVDKFPVNINENLELLEREVGKADIVICTTDNNKSRFNLSPALVRQEKIGIFGRAVTRAEGGDVFIYRPGGPCYCCLIGNEWFRQTPDEITNVASARRNGQIAAYVSEEDADAVVQVGLSSDIEPICNMMVKIALMELSRGVPSGISCLEEELVYDYYMWANRRERRHRNWAPMPGAGAKPTIMRWYGAHIPRNENCALCSCHETKLDEGEELMENYGNLIQETDLTGVKPEE